MGEKPPGAGFRDGDGLSGTGQKPGHDGLQGGGRISIDDIGQAGLQNGGQNIGRRGGGLLRALGEGSDMEIDLPGRSQDGQADAA